MPSPPKHPVPGLHVSSLPDDVDEAGVREYFRRYGQLRRVKLVDPRGKHRSADGGANPVSHNGTSRSALLEFDTFPAAGLCVDHEDQKHFPNGRQRMRITWQRGCNPAEVLGARGPGAASATAATAAKQQQPQHRASDSPASSSQPDLARRTPPSPPNSDGGGSVVWVQQPSDLSQAVVLPPSPPHHQPPTPSSATSTTAAATVVYQMPPAHAHYMYVQQNGNGDSPSGPASVMLVAYPPPHAHEQGSPAPPQYHASNFQQLQQHVGAPQQMAFTTAPPHQPQMVYAMQTQQHHHQAHPQQQQQPSLQQHGAPVAFHLAPQHQYQPQPQPPSHQPAFVMMPAASSLPTN